MSGGKADTDPYESGLERNAANYVPLTPLSFLARAAHVYPKRTACIHGERNSFSEPTSPNDA